MKKIIFICHGNICRSPMAEMIFRQLAREVGGQDEFTISSAAVSYEEIGNPIYPPAARKLKEKGISQTPHSAHRITPEEARESDLLIIMDSSNERLLRHIIAPGQHHKIHYMMEFAQPTHERTQGSIQGQENRLNQINVSDPWYTGDFEKTYQDIYCACKGLLKQLTK